MSRCEDDPRKIRVTGIPGGGTQTSYIAALDDRVAAAAPTCYITSLQRLFESIGPQDAEQNLNGGVRHGIDHADFLELRAPKPTLVVSTTRDFFSIQGARETFAEAKKAFTSMGAEDELMMVEDDFGHGYTKKTGESIYSFFQRFLSNPGSSLDETVEMLPSEELTVMASGQVTETLGGETVFSINRTEAKGLIDRLEMSRRNISAHLQKVKAEAANISGYVPTVELSGLVYRGRYQRDGYSVEKYVIDGEKDCVIPFLLMVPDGGSKYPALIYLHPEGKSAGAAVGGEMEGFVKQGYIVLSPDLSGSGELGSVSDYVSGLTTS